MELGNNGILECSFRILHAVVQLRSVLAKTRVA